MLVRLSDPAPTPLPSPRSHVAALDGLRGVAFGIVFLYHLCGDLMGRRPFWIQGGFLGVDVFFVLSGYLLTSLLLEDTAHSRRVPWRPFYARRVVRLYPALLVFCAVHLAYVVAVGLPVRVQLWSIGGVLLGVGNYLRLPGGAIVNEGFAHLWTLSVEWQFYLVAPLLVAVAVRPRRRTAVTGVIIGVIAVALLRRHLYDSGELFVWQYLHTHTRADSILVGVALALGRPVLARVPRVASATAGWLGVAIVAFGVSRWTVAEPLLYRWGGYTLIAFGAAAVIAASLLQTGPSRLLCSRPLCALGKVAYGGYLWHAFVITAVARWAKNWPIPAQMGLATGATAAFTVASWLLLEKPVLEAYRRWARRGTTDAHIEVAPDPAPLAPS